MLIFFIAFAVLFLLGLAALGVEESPAFSRVDSSPARPDHGRWLN